MKKVLFATSLLLSSAGALAGEPITVVDLIVDAQKLNGTVITVSCEKLYGARASAIYCGNSAGESYVFIESRTADSNGLRKALELCGTVARKVPAECTADVTGTVFSAPIGVQLKNSTIVFK